MAKAIKYTFLDNLYGIFKKDDYLLNLPNKLHIKNETNMLKVNNQI